MKRMICVILAVSLFLTGCGFYGTRIKNPVTFYYLCDKYQTDLCCVIVSEEREAAGHTDDLSYLLALYLMGPTDDENVSPLRPGTRIKSERKDDTVYLELTEPFQILSDIEFSLVCSCLTLTCLNITDAKTVTITSGERSKTMSQDTITLYDTIAEPIPTEETT